MKPVAWTLFLGFCSFLGGLTAVGLVSRGLSHAHAQSTPPRAAKLESEASRLSARFELVARSVSPAVVALQAVKPVVRGGKSKAEDDSGSGVLVRFPGRRGTFVLTNNHVIH